MSRLRGTWLVQVAAAELVGFSGPALAGVLLADSSPPWRLAGMVLAGSTEGAILGWAQARLLVRVVPGLDRRAWLVASVAGAALAWLLGMLPTTTYDLWEGWPTSVTVVGAAPLAVVLLISIGTAQAVTLPARTRRLLWAATTTVAWCGGLAAFGAVTSPLWHPGQGPLLIGAIGLLGGLAMALVMAATTGWAVERVAVRPSRPVSRTRRHGLRRQQRGFAGTSME
jgi:hypothetical protein